MSKASNISSLTELRDRREEIKAEQEAARQGLTSTLAAAPAKAKDYALEDLALPALGVGLAVYVGYRVLRPRKQREEEPQSAVYPPPPQHLQQPQRDQVGTAPAPSAVRASRPTRPAPAIARKAVKSSFNLAKLMAVGKMLIPAAQAIMSVVQEQQAKK